MPTPRDNMSPRLANQWNPVSALSHFSYGTGSMQNIVDVKRFHHHVVNLIPATLCHSETVTAIVHEEEVELIGRDAKVGNTEAQQIAVADRLVG